MADSVKLLILVIVLFLHIRISGFEWFEIRLEMVRFPKFRFSKTPTNINWHLRHTLPFMHQNVSISYYVLRTHYTQKLKLRKKKYLIVVGIIVIWAEL